MRGDFENDTQDDFLTCGSLLLKLVLRIAGEMVRGRGGGGRMRHGAQRTGTTGAMPTLFMRYFGHKARSCFARSTTCWGESPN
eukprot:11602100-Alexandrium_andersonii.AAC.1